jgi:hypothetical protein
MHSHACQTAAALLEIHELNFRRPLLTYRVHVASTDVGSKVDDHSLWGSTVQVDRPAVSITVQVQCSTLLYSTCSTV